MKDQNDYKCIEIDKSNIHPSNLKRLLDDCFPYKVKNRNVFKLKNTRSLIQVPCVTLFGGYAGSSIPLEVSYG